MSSGDLIVHVEGIGWWSAGLPDWPAAAQALRAGTVPAEVKSRPAATILPPNERRRATEPVLLACDVGGQACAMAMRSPADLPCIFTSAHGDLEVTDGLCATLASEPLEVSPTRFHNSVHNAPAGYWTIAAHCLQPSCAMSAQDGSFAAGLLEAAIHAHAEQTPVLFAAYDNAVRGPLGDVVQGSDSFGTALVIHTERTSRTIATLTLRHLPQESAPSPTPAPWTPLAHTTPVAASMPLFLALARSVDADIVLRNGASTALSIGVRT
jgi:Beta-ketoacyl synthase, N-terminal domain